MRTPLAVSVKGLMAKPNLETIESWIVVLVTKANRDENENGYRKYGNANGIFIRN